MADADEKLSCLPWMLPAAVRAQRQRGWKRRVAVACEGAKVVGTTRVWKLRFGDGNRYKYYYCRPGVGVKNVTEVGAKSQQQSN